MDECVGEQFGQDLVEAVIVALDDDGFLGQVQQPVVVGGQGAGVVQCVEGQAGEVYGFAGQGAARVQAREEEQVVDQAAQPL
ncbi:hypothetical protein [Streptomyces sp. TRM68367]|uniref:hypothetical protein n=1 Tax=Streptomyces sp. TRM68367 TaxID=2758415 RepID=UPI0037DD668B